MTWTDYQGLKKNCLKISKNVRNPSSNVGKSLVNLRQPSIIFGNLRVIFANIRKSSDDFRKSSVTFENRRVIFGIFESVRMIFGNLQKSLGDLRHPTIIITIIIMIIIKNNIIIIIRTFPESFSPEKFILGNKFVNFKRSNLLRSRNMSTNHEIPLILNLVWWRHQSRDYAQKRLFSLLWKQIFIKSKKRNVVRSTLLLVI